MPRMVSLKRSKADSEKERGVNGPATADYSNPDDEGVAVNLDHHHLMKLKGGDGEPIAGRMKSGHKVSFSGEGTVERSESRSGKDGERHSATIRLHKGSMEHEPGQEDEREGLRSELAATHEKAEARAAKGAK